MSKEDQTPHALVGRAGLVFAYVSFALALVLFGSAIFLLPLERTAKLFLGAAVVFLTTMFVFLAVMTHMIMRSHATHEIERQKQVSAKTSAGANGSQPPR